MLVVTYQCDSCGKEIPKDDVIAMARNGDIRVPSSNLRVRFAALRIEKGGTDLWDLCPECRTLITRCILENRPWAQVSALPSSQRSLLLHTSQSE